MFGFLKGKTDRQPAEGEVKVEEKVPAPNVRKPMRPFELKIKAKSLGAEARIIRQEEARALRIAKKLAKSKHPHAAAFLEKARAQYHSLKDHRMVDVRSEARATNLARGFLRGIPYVRVEQRVFAFNQPSQWDKVRAMVRKYTNASNAYMDELESWIVTGEAAVHVITDDERQDAREARLAHRKPTKTKDEWEKSALPQSNW